MVDTTKQPDFLTPGRLTPGRFTPDRFTPDRFSAGRPSANRRIADRSSADRLTARFEGSDNCHASRQLPFEASEQDPHLPATKVLTRKLDPTGRGLASLNLFLNKCYCFDSMSACPVAKSTGNELCSSTISHFPLIFRSTSVVRTTACVCFPSLSVKEPSAM